MADALPIGGSQVYVEKYTYDHTNDSSENFNSSYGVALEAHAGVGVTDDIEVFSVLAGISGAVRTGYDFSGEYGDYFASFGARATLMTSYFVHSGFEAGYRINSRGEDHPYIAVDAGLHVFTLGPFIGYSFNPNNIGPDRVISQKATATTDSSGAEINSVKVKSNDSMDAESSLYFGLRVLF